MVARKMRISDIVSGSFEDGRLKTAIGEAEEIRILGTVVDSFLSGDGNYASLTLDDGTETLRLKQWGAGVSSIKSMKKGDLIEIVGKPRLYNDEIYVMPDIMLQVSPNRWVAHELETMALALKNTPRQEGKEEKKAEGIETFDIFEEDDYVEAVFSVMKDKMLTKKEIIAVCKLDEIDVELALRQLLDDGRIELSGGKYKRTL